MGWGGKRAGAGRPEGTRKYKEPTKPIRVPESLVDSILEYAAHGGYRVPFYSSAVQAGFPSPADDHVENRIDLNEHLVPNPASTFLVRASGDSMINVGIFEGDTLVVDRSLEPANGKIIIAAVDGYLTVKRLEKTTTATYLVAENDDYPPIEITQENDTVIWGVVTNVIHQL